MEPRGSVSPTAGYWARTVSPSPTTRAAKPASCSFAAAASAVTAARRRFVDELRPAAKEGYRLISNGREVLDFLKQLHEEGNTVVIITHDNSIAVEAERVVKISDGKIIFDGDVKAYESIL